MPVKRLSTVEKAFRVLTEVSERQPIGLGELARSLELDKAAVQRILATLDDLGWIAPAAPPATGWELTPKPSSSGAGTRQRPLAGPRAPRGPAGGDRRDHRAGHRRPRPGGGGRHRRQPPTPTGHHARRLRGPARRLPALPPRFFPDDELDALAEAGTYTLTRRRPRCPPASGLVPAGDGHVRCAGHRQAPVTGPAGTVRAAVLVVAPRTRLPRDRQPIIGAQLRAAAAELGRRSDACASAGRGRGGRRRRRARRRHTHPDIVVEPLRRQVLQALTHADGRGVRHCGRPLDEPDVLAREAARGCGDRRRTRCRPTRP